MLILDMEIPERCWECPMQRYAVRSDNHICVITGKLAEDIEERSAFCPIKSEIPKGATNGDVAKALFGIGSLKLSWKCRNQKWWDAPYRRENEIPDK